MGTRSAIGIKHGDVVRAVYCHYDGYLEHNGLILATHYTNSVKVNKMISLGDMSVLDQEIEPTDETHSFENRQEGVTVFYGRDRGEGNVDFRTFQSEQDFLENFNAGEEFHYLFKNGAWYYSEYGSEFKELTPDLIVKLLKQPA